MTADAQETGSVRPLRNAIAASTARGEVDAHDIVVIRRAMSAEGPIGQELVEALFALDRAEIRKCPGWASLFVEAVTDHIVWESRPTGVVDHGQAEWLVRNVDAARTLTAFAALVNVLAEADRVPAWLAPAARARAAAGWPGLDQALAAAAAEQRQAA